MGIGKKTDCANKRLDKSTESEGRLQIRKQVYGQSQQPTATPQPLSTNAPPTTSQQLKRGSKQINNQVSDHGRGLKFLARAGKNA